MYREIGVRSISICVDKVSGRDEPAFDRVGCVDIAMEVFDLLYGHTRTHAHVQLSQLEGKGLQVADGTVCDIHAIRQNQRPQHSQPLSDLFYSSIPYSRVSQVEALYRTTIRTQDLHRYVSEVDTH